MILYDRFEYGEDEAVSTMKWSPPADTASPIMLRDVVSLYAYSLTGQSESYLIT